MNIIKDLIDYLSKLFTWWIAVQPWEQGLRVRAGNHEKLLYPGLHFRVPVLDKIYVQTDRLRMVNIPVQTLTTKCGKTITTAFSYSICDISKLYHTLYHPELTISNMIMAKVASFIATHRVEESTPAHIEEAFKLSVDDNGIKDLKINVTGYAIVRTYRLIQEGSWVNEGFKLDEFSAK